MVEVAKEGDSLIPIYEKGKTAGDKRVPEVSFVERFSAAAVGPAPIVIICPGGGYTHLAAHEGEDIAEWFNERGIHAAVFYYQLEAVDIDLLLNQVEELIQGLREEENFTQIGLMGFSAGGHLAALCSAKNEEKADFSILCYPVISLTEPLGHMGSREQLLAGASDEKVKQYSPAECVTADSPKTFLWHTAEDRSVPVENALLYATRLSTHQVPYELHIFQEGRHGLGLALEEPFTKDWTNLLENWLRKNGVLV